MILDVHNDAPETVKVLGSLKYSLIFIVLALSRIVILVSLYSINRIANKSKQPIAE